jgi:putative endonuclease
VVIPSEARDLQLRTERRYYVYIMASRSLTLYAGVTDNIYRRALEHKSGKIDGFTKRYNINRLVYYETLKYIGNAIAIAREKQVKAWTRAKRIASIKSLNPTWQDLADGWGGKWNCRSLASLGMTRNVKMMTKGLKIRKHHGRFAAKCARCKI